MFYSRKDFINKQGNTRTWRVDCPVLSKKVSRSAQSSAYHWGTQVPPQVGFPVPVLQSMQKLHLPPLLGHLFSKTLNSPGPGIIGKKKREMDRQLNEIVTPLHLQKPAKNTVGKWIQFFSRKQQNCTTVDFGPTHTWQVLITRIYHIPSTITADYKTNICFLLITKWLWSLRVCKG